MADQAKLVSTVPGSTPDAIAQVGTESQAAASDSFVLTSEIQASVQGFLASLAASGVIEDDDPLAQLSAAEPAVAAFVATLQAAITNAKATTTAGLLLAQQLQAGSITQAQFESAVQGIVLSAAALQAITALQLPGATQNLLLALASSNKLNTLKKLNGPNDGENSNITSGGADPGKLPQTALLTAPGSVQLESEFKDEKLSFLQNLFKVTEAIFLQNKNASIASLISLNPQPRIMTGARAVLRINNNIVALCNNVQYEVSTDWQEIRGIDELIPNDLAPTSYSVKGSMSIYRVPNRSPVKDFLQQDMFRGIIWPLTTIEIRDKRTDELIMLVKRAAITNRSESFTKNQLTSTNLSFVGIGFRDEAMPEVLPDKLPGGDASDPFDTSQFLITSTSNSNIA